MKKLIALLLALMLCLSFAACNGKEAAQTTEQDEESTPAEEVAVPEPPVPRTDGYYLLASICNEGTGELVDDPETLAATGLDEMHFCFSDDGTGVVYLNPETGVPFTYDDTTIYIDGELQPYTVEDDAMSENVWLSLEMSMDGATVILDYYFMPGEPPAATLDTELVQDVGTELVGWWEADFATVDDQSYDKGDLAEVAMPYTLYVFYEDGTGYDLRAGPEPRKVTYDSGHIYYPDDGTVLSYLSEDGTLLINNDTVVSFLVRGEGEVPSTTTAADPAESEAPAESETPVEPDTLSGSGDPIGDYWNGQWYGWWVIREGTGMYADLAGQRWDLAAEIAYDAQTTRADITLWDKDTSRSSPIGEVSVLIDPMFGDFEFGTAGGRGGYFFLDTISAGDWFCDPSTAPYDNLIVFDGEYADIANSFSYSVYLRPWGQRWDDIEADDPDDLPAHYDDWYLPLIDAGASMPEVLPADG